MIALLFAVVTLTATNVAPSDADPAIAFLRDARAQAFGIAAKLPGQDWEDVLPPYASGGSEDVVFFDLGLFGWRTLELHLRGDGRAADVSIPEDPLLYPDSILDSPEALNQFGLHQIF